MASAANAIQYETRKGRGRTASPFPSKCPIFGLEPAPTVSGPALVCPSRSSLRYPRSRIPLVLSLCRGFELSARLVNPEARHFLLQQIGSERAEITYPEAQHDRFDPVVERLEDSFRAERPRLRSTNYPRLGEANPRYAMTLAATADATHTECFRGQPVLSADP